MSEKASQSLYSNSSLWVGMGFLIVYLIFILPFGYFRHDDWFILGNAATRLEGNWEFLFRTTLFHFEEEVIWFFRPLFKFIVYVFYKIYGYNYYFWLSTLLAFTLGMLWAGYNASYLLTRNRTAASLFVVFFACSVHFHFGSLVWAGEGMMNCPEMFCLAVCTWLFLDCIFRTEKESIFLKQVLGLGFYSLALGFKESSVAHFVFLTALLIFEPRLRALPLKRKINHIAPYIIFSVCYLGVRLFLMPLNKSYAPSYNLSLLGVTFIIFLGTFTIPIFAWLSTLYVNQRNLIAPWLHALSRRWGYFIFLAAIIVPYFGQSFFSPGWLFFPGFYFAMVLSLSTAEIAKKVRPVQVRSLATLLLILTSIPVAYRLNELGWWQWHIGQQQLLSIIQSAPQKSVKQVSILDCQTTKKPVTNIRKVVGWEGSIYEVWRLTHGNSVPIKILGCQDMPKVNLDDELLLKWEFAHFEIVSVPKS